ncbi:MAG: hypothetical protein QOH09_1314 [Pseudonocardiales bacterium]|nr:hypothetical protein [Pseudonocardiales bacterium]
MQPAGMVTLGVGGVLSEPGGVAHRFGQILGEVANVPTGFLGAAEDALDVHLRPEPDHVRGFDQLFARLIERRQWRTGVGVGEGLRSRVPDRHPLAGVDELVMGGPPHLVVGRFADRP